MGRIRALVLLAVFGCQGSIADGESDLDVRVPSGSGVVVETPDGVVRSFDPPSSAAFLRLHRAEYAAIVRSAFPELDEGLNFEDFDLPSDAPIKGRRARPSGAIGEVQLEKYLDAALRVAESLDPALMDDVEVFVRERGRRLFRAPVQDALVEELIELEGELSAIDGVDAREVFDGMIARLLTSPRFLSHFELGAERAGDAILLSADELAARLARALWNGAPDEALADAARRGALDDAAGVRAQAERMLADPRADAMLWRFHAAWLRIDSMARVNVDEATRGDADLDAIRSQMVRETQRLVARAAGAGEGGFELLFNAQTTEVEPELAEIYGMAHDGEGALELALSEERAGVLGHGAFLLSTASAERRNNAIFRGIVFSEHFLCMEPPPFPMDEEIDTTAEVDRLESAQCAGCHVQFETYGRLFDGYDALGRFDGTGLGEGGVVARTEDLNGTYANLAEVGDALANSGQAHRCYAEHWFDYLADRHVDARDAEGTIERDERFVAGDVRALLLDILSSDAFRERYMPDVSCEEAP